jgi:integrase
MSLGHQDKAAASAYAAEQHAKLVQGQAELTEGRPSLARLLSIYETHRTPNKREAEQTADRRRSRLFTRFLGAAKDPTKITLADWERFIDARRSGALNPTGEKIADPEKRKPVRDRTVEADLKWLRAVFNWTTKWQDRNGHYLLRENPVRGFPVPKEKNPRRPVATQDRYEALRAVSDQVMMRIRVGSRQQLTRAYLSELLDLANETGRRLSAILNLRYDNLGLTRTAAAPHGVVSWPADTDKQGREWLDVPVSAVARAAIDRVLAERPGIGSAPLFPAPMNPSKPASRHLADAWLRKAESLAGLEPQPGSLWHAFRRKAATELKGAPDKDVMALLGWKDLQSLKTAYQQADPETMLVALENRHELRQLAQ